MARARRLIASFRDVGAMSRTTSRSLSDLGVRDSLLFRRLAGQGVFVNTRGDNWYLDDEMAQRWRRRVRRRMLVIMGVVLVVMVIVMAVGG